MLTIPWKKTTLILTLTLLPLGCRRSEEVQPTQAPAPAAPNTVQNTVQNIETPAQPIVVEQPPTDQQTIIDQAPPAPYAEVIPASPGPDFVWVGGYWVASNHRWVWVHGRYDRPPNHGATWERGGYERQGNRFEFRAGHWR